jgi:Tfp pilus assembly PilM family ATPase
MTVALPSRRTRILPIGLDIGRRAIRMAQLRSGPFGYEVVRGTRLPMPHTPGGEIDRAVAAEGVRRVIRQQRFTGRTALAAVGAPDAEFHLLQLPRETNPATGGPAVQAELSRLLRHSPSDLQMAHWWLPPAHGEAVGAIGVAVPRSHVAFLCALLADAGLECTQIDADACALVRFAAMLRGNGPDLGRQVWGLLDLGSRGARLILFLGDTPVLARAFDSGGQKWTQQIAEWFGISEESAEVHKHDHGVAERTTPENESGPGELGGMMLGALRTEIEQVTLQIERSYAYVLQCYAQTSAGELVLVGGGAELKGLSECLEQKLGIRVSRADDLLERPTCRLKDLRPAAERRVALGELAAAIGLAIGGEVSG